MQRDIRLGLTLLVVTTLSAVAPAAPVAPGLAGQIARNPTGVNVAATGATTVFITFGNLEGYVPVEALWCGALVPAAPALGDRCDDGTLFGALPLRFDRSRSSGADGFTDVMSIPPSVARRAYQAAAAGDDSRFFYVRRFVDPNGVRPDQFVSVTCRMTDGGARTPFSLLDVRLRFAPEVSVMSVPVGTAPPPLEARIAYNGTGRLVGRWEVVRPGEDPPTADDLLTEATLPAELRGTQRRYTELERFNVFLPPSGRVTLPGPDPASLPTDAAGLYQVLLRVEASDDKEGDTDLGAAGAGSGVVATGAVAGFPLPVLRYFVGAESSGGIAGARLRLLSPDDDTEIAGGRSTVFSWSHVATAVMYRLEIRDLTGHEVLAAVLQAGIASYAAPPWLSTSTPDGSLTWRVQALDADGVEATSTDWRTVRVRR